MINLELLNGRIKDSGVKKSFIAKEMHISPAGLSKKLNGESDFMSREIVSICSVLHISPQEMMRIFFNK